MLFVGFGLWFAEGRIETEAKWDTLPSLSRARKGQLGSSHAQIMYCTVQYKSLFDSNVGPALLSHYDYL